MFCKKYKERIAELEATVANLTAKCKDQDFEIGANLVAISLKDKTIEELKFGYNSQLQQNKNWEEKYEKAEKEWEQRDLSCNEQYTKVRHENIDLKEELVKYKVELDKLVESHESLRKENTDLHMRLGISSDQLRNRPTKKNKQEIELQDLIYSIYVDPKLVRALSKISQSCKYISEVTLDHVTSAGYKKNTWTKIQKLQEKYK